MRRKEQEARIEQQRQEKEKAREDAARERARSAIPSRPIISMASPDGDPEPSERSTWWINFGSVSVCVFLFLCVLRDREERMAALSAAQQEAMEELQKKIQMKVGSTTTSHCSSTRPLCACVCVSQDPCCD